MFIPVKYIISLEKSKKLEVLKNFEKLISDITEYLLN